MALIAGNSRIFSEQLIAVTRLPKPCHPERSAWNVAGRDNKWWARSRRIPKIFPSLCRYRGVLTIHDRLDFELEELL